MEVTEIQHHSVGILPSIVIDWDKRTWLHDDNIPLANTSDEASKIGVNTIPRTMWLTILDPVDKEMGSELVPFPKSYDVSVVLLSNQSHSDIHVLMRTGGSSSRFGCIPKAIKPDWD